MAGYIRKVQILLGQIQKILRDVTSRDNIWGLWETIKVLCGSLGFWLRCTVTIWVWHVVVFEYFQDLF